MRDAGLDWTERAGSQDAAHARHTTPRAYAPHTLTRGIAVAVIIVSSWFAGVVYLATLGR